MDVENVKTAEWPSGPVGPKGPKGSPGPYAAGNELELISYITNIFIATLNNGYTFPMGDGVNPQKAVDEYALMQAIDLLKNYRALLNQNLFELIPPGFYHTCQKQNMVEGVR